MSRLTDALLPSSTAFAQGVNAPILDPRYGGQMGYAPDYTAWVSNQQYIRRNLVCVLVEAPSGMQSLPNPDYWVGTLRALVELHALSIQGLQMGLEVEFAETPVGGGGNMQEDVTDVKMTRSQVSFKFNEKYGLPVFRFFNGWIRYLMQDPETKFALINTINGNAATDMLADRMAATMLFFEPDPTHTKVMKAWLGTNMMPKLTGENTGVRDLTQPGEKVDYDIGFTGIYQVGSGVDAFAQSILNGMNITGANPFSRQAFINSIDADVLAQKQSYGNGISDLTNTQVRV